MNNSNKTLLPVLILFIIISGLVFAAGSLCANYGIDKNVLLGANLFFLLLSIFVFFLQKRSISNANPNAFVRAVIGGMMIKMFAVVIAVLVYVVSAGNAYNKRAVFISLLIYLIYLGAEVSAIQKLLRKKNV